MIGPVDKVSLPRESPVPKVSAPLPPAPEVIPVEIVTEPEGSNVEAPDEIDTPPDERAPKVLISTAPDATAPAPEDKYTAPPTPVELDPAFV
jgi:hypothetical protein